MRNKQLAMDLIVQLSLNEREAYQKRVDDAEKSGAFLEHPTSGRKSIYAGTLEVRIQRIATARSQILSAQSALRDNMERCNSLRRLANALAEEIEPDRLVPVRDRLQELNSSSGSLEPTQMPYQEIIAVIRSRDGQRSWKANEVASQLPGVHKKQVYNALQWGLQTGQLTRVSHGRYRHADIGFGIETAADIGEPDQDDN
jgi:hypothetical protein